MLKDDQICDLLYTWFTDLIKCMKHQGFAYPFTASLAVYHQVLDPSLDNLDVKLIDLIQIMKTYLGPCWYWNDHQA